MTDFSTAAPLNVTPRDTSVRWWLLFLRHMIWSQIWELKTDKSEIQGAFFTGPPLKSSSMENLG